MGKDWVPTCPGARVLFRASEKLYKQRPRSSWVCWDAQTTPRPRAKMGEDQPFKCPRCGEQFSKREGFQRKRHLAEHGLELFWRCSLCDYQTPSRRYHDHQKHWQARHFGEQVPPEPRVQTVGGVSDSRRVRKRSPSQSPGDRGSATPARRTSTPARRSSTPVVTSSRSRRPPVRRQGRGQTREETPASASPAPACVPAEAAVPQQLLRGGVLSRQPRWLRVQASTEGSRREESLHPRRSLPSGTARGSTPAEKAASGLQQQRGDPRLSPAALQGPESPRRSSLQPQRPSSRPNSPLPRQPCSLQRRRVSGQQSRPVPSSRYNPSPSSQRW